MVRIVIIDMNLIICNSLELGLIPNKEFEIIRTIDQIIIWIATRNP